MKRANQSQLDGVLTALPVLAIILLCCGCLRTDAPPNPTKIVEPASATTKGASPGIDDETAESICRSHLKTRVKDPSCELESIQRSPGRILVLLRKKSVSETGYGAVFHVQLDSETGAVVDDAVEIRENR